MNSKHELVKIGELSRQANVSCRAIRYYEELKLISPTKTSEGGFRLYDNNALHKLNVIKEFKKLGLSLDEIKSIMLPAPSMKKSELLDYSRKVIKFQLKKIEIELDRLTKLKDQNKLALAMLDQCQKCPEKVCPSDCLNKKAYVK